jgi:uridine kinase
VTRALVLDELAAGIASVSLGHPVRVAIDGRCGSGKTMLADELAARLPVHGRPVVRASIDGFHRPRAARYARGRTSPEGYYDDAYDLDAVVTLLLRPLGPGGDRRYRAASFDLKDDCPLEQAATVATADAILVVDGSFLQRPELSPYFDVTIHVATADDIAAARAIKRDAELLGGPKATGQLYAQRYGPAFDLYQHLCAPAARADAVLNNDDLVHPRLTIRPGGRLAAKTVT